MSSEQYELQLTQYDDGAVNVELRLETGSQDGVWATQSQMADVFGVTTGTINSHLLNIFSSGELDKAAVIKDFLITAADGKAYKTKHYNLAAIISVGFRVSGPRATRFRQWANGVLHEYATKGYVLNEELLKNDLDRLNELSDRVRALRAEEKALSIKLENVSKLVHRIMTHNHMKSEAFTP